VLRRSFQSFLLIVALSLPGNGPARAEDANREVARARDSYLAGRFVECLRILEDMPETHRNAGARNMIGGSQAKLGRTEEAERTFRGAISRYPEHLAAYYNLAQLLTGRQSYDEAISILKVGLQIFPRSDRLLRGLGTAYQVSGHFRDARTVFQRWVQLSPASDEPYAMLGDSYLESGDYTSAMASLSKAEECNPRNARVRYLLALAHSYLGQVAESQLLLRSVIEVDPSFCLAYDQLAKNELDRGSEEPALEFLKKAIECDPTLAQAHYQLSRVYFRRGEKALAEEETRTFLKFRLPSQGKGMVSAIRP
jgi:protein O-GlcNAc transferase